MTIAVFPQVIGSMNEAILFCGTLLFAFAFRIIGRVLDNKQLNIKGKEYSAQGIFYKALSVALFLLYMPQLFMREAIADQVGLTAAVDELPYITALRMPFSPTETALVAILKWMTTLTVKGEHFSCSPVIQRPP